MTMINGLSYWAELVVSYREMGMAWGKAVWRLEEGIQFS